MAVCFEQREPALDEILLRHGLKAEDLDKQCPLQVRNEVAIKIVDWEMVGHCFNFPPEKIEDIKLDNESQERCKVALLDTWSEREGEEATYLKLANVLHRCKRQDIVEFLCEKVKSFMRLLPLSGVPDTRWDMSTAAKPHPVSITEEYGDTVLSQIEALEEQFRDIHGRLVTELSTNEGISIDQVLQALTMLPFAIRRQYQDTIQTMLPDLESEDRISSLFDLLHPLFSFMDYELLKHLVSKFGSPRLKEEMAVYAEKVQLFKRATTVSDLVEYWPGIELPESNYSRLRAKIGGDPGTYTLEELDKFRRTFFGQMRLSEFVSASILLQLERSNSFIVIWLIPTVVVPKLVEVTKQQLGAVNVFFQEERVLQLSVDKQTLYTNERAMESQSPSVSTHYNANVAEHELGGVNLSIANSKGPIFHLYGCCKTTTSINKTRGQVERVT